MRNNFSLFNGKDGMEKMVRKEVVTHCA